MSPASLVHDMNQFQGVPRLRGVATRRRKARQVLGKVYKKIICFDGIREASVMHLPTPSRQPGSETGPRDEKKTQNKG